MSRSIPRKPKQGSARLLKSAAKRKALKANGGRESSVMSISYYDAKGVKRTLKP